MLRKIGLALTFGLALTAPPAAKAGDDADLYERVVHEARAIFRTNPAAGATHFIRETMGQAFIDAFQAVDAGQYALFHRHFIVAFTDPDSATESLNAAATVVRGIYPRYVHLAAFATDEAIRDYVAHSATVNEALRSDPGLCRALHETGMTALAGTEYGGLDDSGEMHAKAFQVMASGKTRKLLRSRSPALLKSYLDRESTTADHATDHDLYMSKDFADPRFCDAAARVMRRLADRRGPAADAYRAEIVRITLRDLAVHNGKAAQSGLPR